MSQISPRIVVMGSTRGTSIQGTLDAIRAKTLQASVVAIVSNTADAPILQRASHYNIPAVAVVPNMGESRTAYDRRMMDAIDVYSPHIVVMVGYMRIVGGEFCTHYHNRLFNVHPSLLPRHAGLMDIAVHQAVLDGKDTTSGCTIHRVSEVVDSGQNVLQLSCAVKSDDTVHTLKSRVQDLESQAWIDLIKDWKKYV